MNSLDTCMEYVFLYKLQIAPVLFATWASCFHPMSEILGRSCPIVAEPPVQPLMSYKSQTSIVRTAPIGSMYGIFTYVYYKDQPNVGKYTIHGSYWVHNDSISITWFSKTWSHRLPNPRSAPSLPMQFHDKLMFILLTFNASAWAWGRTRMANHFKPENLQRHVQHQTFEAKRSRVEVNVNESLTCLDVCRWSSSWSVISIFEWDFRMCVDLNWSKSQLTSVVSFRNSHRVILILDQSFPTFMCFHDVFWWRSSTTVASMTCTSVLMWRCLGCISPTYPRPMPF